MREIIERANLKENTMETTTCKTGEHNYTPTHNQHDSNGIFQVFQMTCTKCGAIIKPNEVKE